MSIESELAKLTAAIEANTAALLSQPAPAASTPAPEPEPEPEPEKPKAAKKPKPKPAPEPATTEPATEEPPVIVLDDHANKLASLRQFVRGKLDGGADLKILDQIGAEFGVTGLPYLTTEQMDDFRKAVEERM
jgi:hypothetical protein